MYEVSPEFREKLLAGAVQSIRGTLTLVDGSAPITLDDSNLIGSPEVEMQCTENAENFGFGQLYTGSVVLTLDLPDLMRDQLRGGEITLETGVDGEYVPLGVWTITDPQRDSAGRLKVTGLDCVSRLDVPIKTSGACGAFIGLRLEIVSELTGVEFAQTQADLYRIFGQKANRYGLNFAPNCRQEVANIARVLGGFACANRFGRIEFRRYGSSPVGEIPENLRFSADLSEYDSAITALTYTDDYGRDTTVNFSKSAQVNTELNLHFSGNNFFFGEGNFTPLLEQIAGELSQIPVWTPGEVRYYGDPTLDLGDLVTLTGGKTGTAFLITAIRWKFRAPQTLISAGAGDVSSGSNSSYTSGVSSAAVTMNITKSNCLIDLDIFENPPDTGIQEAGEIILGVRNSTTVLILVSAIAEGGEVHVLLDGVMQTIFDCTSFSGSRTVSLTVPVNLTAGQHRISVEIMDCTLHRLSASVWGQDITTDIGQPTFADQYVFSEGIVQKYKGSATSPVIPDTIDGEQVRIIDGGAFENSGVEFTKIPEGTEEIQ